MVSGAWKVINKRKGKSKKDLHWLQVIDVSLFRVFFRKLEILKILIPVKIVVTDIIQPFLHKSKQNNFHGKDGSQENESISTAWRLITEPVFIHKFLKGLSCYTLS